MKVNLLLHDDWELNGDGSGDIEELMFKPAETVLRLCDSVGAKYTFFAEIGQQWAMKASPYSHHRRWAERWDELMRKAVQSGHDVQLHLHPQWIGAKSHEKGFALDFSKWSIARLDPEMALKALGDGKRYLMYLLAPVAKDYDVVAFRAGGFAIQPFASVRKILRDLKILADVTVIRGMKMENDRLGDIDFTDAPSSISPWFPGEDILNPLNHYENIFCLPVFSIPTRLPLPFFAFLRNPLSLGYYVRKRMHDRKKNYRALYQNASSGGSGRRASLSGKIFSPRALVCDFGQMHSTTVLSMVDRFLENASRESVETATLILFTHSKQFFDPKNFEKLLSGLAKKPLAFRTTRDTVSALNHHFSSDSERRTAALTA